MTKAKKIALWTMCGAGGIFLLLFLALALLAPRLIQLEAVKEKLLSQLEEQTGIHAEFKRIDLSFFPTPRLIIHSGTMELPGKMNGTMESLTLVPRVLPLLQGEIKPDTVRIKSPEIALVIPEMKRTEESEETGLSIGAIEKKVLAALSFLKPEGPGVIVTVSDGNLSIWDTRNNHYWFKHVNARAAVSEEKLELDLTGRQSSLWENVVFHAWLTPADLKSSGRLILKGSSPDRLQAYCCANAPTQFGESRLDMDLSFSSEGPRIVQASFDAFSPLITIFDGDKRLELKDGSAGGSFTLDGRKLEATLDKLNFRYPQVNLTGKFLRDPAAHNVTIDLEGKDMDATSVRRVALALQGDKEIVRKLFEIIQEGQVPSITFSARGRVMKDLRKPENHLIRGNIVHGTVYIPKIRLLIEDVVGDVVISNNILEGKNLVGRAGRSLGSDGWLRVALTTGDGPFHLDITIDADLSELPPVLQRSVKNDPFQRELALMKDVKGKAHGRMILGETLDDVKTRLEVGAFELSGDYERIPYQLDLQGKSFFFEDRTIAVTGLTAKFGKSQFTQIDLGYQWEGEPQMQITGPSGTRLSLDEAYPLLLSVETIKSAPKTFEPTKGTLILDSLHFKGPLLKPQSWALNAKGTAEDLVIEGPGFPASPQVKQGKFEATQEKLILNGFQVNFLDANLSVSGTLGEYLKGVSSADLVMQGSVGPQANETLSNLAQVPPQFRALSPFSVSSSRLAWEKGKPIAFSMDMTTPEGPKLSIDVQGIEDGVEIRHLSIKDDESDAFITLKCKKKAFKLGFFGVLGSRSLDKLLVKNDLLTGWIKGSFQSYVRLNQPMASTARGELQAAGFLYSWNLKDPVRIESAHLQAKGSKIKIKSAEVTWQDCKMALKGGVSFSPSGFKLDIDLSADELDYEKLKRLKKDGGEVKVNGEDPARKDIKLRGVLRVKTDRFTFGKLAWNPVEANVYLSDEGLNIEIMRAELCGIPTPGAVQYADGKARFTIQPAARDLDLDSTLTCLWGKKGLLTGTFDLKGDVTSSDNPDSDVVRSLSGDLEMNAKNGRIRRFDLLAKIFTMINVTEIFRGVLPDLLNEGCAYDTIKVKGRLQDGKLIFENSVVDGPCARMVWHGEINLEEKKIDVTVIVAPFRTVDRIIDKVPLVGKLLNGSLISIPVRVSGDLTDPAVVPMSPSAVGNGLLGFMKRTFELPFSLLQPLF